MMAVAFVVRQQREALLGGPLPAVRTTASIPLRCRDRATVIAFFLLRSGPWNDLADPDLLALERGGPRSPHSMQVLHDASVVLF